MRVSICVGRQSQISPHASGVYPEDEGEGKTCVDFDPLKYAHPLYKGCTNVPLSFEASFCPAPFALQMAVTQAYSQNLQRLFTGEGLPDMSPDSFVLMVDRKNIVDSTVVQLIRSDEENFKKPLKVSCVCVCVVVDSL